MQQRPKYHTDEANLNKETKQQRWQDPQYPKNEVMSNQDYATKMTRSQTPYRRSNVK